MNNHRQDDWQDRRWSNGFRISGCNKSSWQEASRWTLACQQCSSHSRYSRNQSFPVLKRNKAFLLVMAAGSVAGTFSGACSLV
jgi:hypothetical protein